MRTFYGYDWLFKIYMLGKPEHAASFKPCAVHMLVTRVSQNRIYKPHTTVCMMISLPKVPYIHCLHMVLVKQLMSP
jgi:hypothetical protein